MHQRANTFYLRTFGCQMNEHDSERIAGLLTDLGMEQVDDPATGGVLVYNTCSVREKADTRLLGHLGRASRLKRENPDRLVVVAGCLVQSRQAELLREYPFIDVLVGPQSLHELPSLLEERITTGRCSKSFEEKTSIWSADLPRRRQRGPLAWIQIMTGCTNYCSYCIVPYVRGPEASRPAKDIVEEARALTAEGVREITLLGQNVNAYGNEPSFEGREDLPTLLELLSEIPGLERIRFMTSHPKDVSPRLIKALAALPPVCEHLHLPVQSGSDRVLTAMRRGYTRSQYLKLVDDLRSTVPGLALTTDLIVGFPGETEQDFAATLSLVEECRFDSAFTFIYSPRLQTRAAELPNRPARSTARERMQLLVALIQRQAALINRGLVGSVVEVLVEGRSRQDVGTSSGKTRTYKTVNFPGRVPPGELVHVYLHEATSSSFRGTRLD